MAASVSSSTTNLRSPFSIPNLLLSALNFTLFILSSASVPPIVLLRTPPTSLGMAFLAVSGVSILSSMVGFYSQLSHLCFVTHLSLLLASLSAQILSVLALFSKEHSSLSQLKSTRDPREAKLLVRLECGVMVAMVAVQTTVLLLSLAVHHCWVREYQGVVEAERGRKQRRRVAKVQEEESEANGAELKEVKDREFDDKFQGKYGKWMKTGFQG